MAIQLWRQGMQIGVTKLRHLSYAKTAQDELQFKKLFKALQKEANKRLDRLESHGFDQYAYELAQDYIRHVNPPLSPNRYEWDTSDMKANYQTMLSMRTFISKKSSTVKGQEEIRRKRLETFRTKLGLQTYQFGKGQSANKGYISNATLDKFIKFLGEQPIRNTLESVSRNVSEEIVELLQGKLSDENSKLRKEILDLFQYYLLSTNHPEKFTRESRLYYNELVDYLKDGVLPRKLNFEEIRKKLYG